MGMFDEVIFTRPMPDGYTAEASFQTKDMQCELATYRVFDDGRMLKMTNGWTEDAPHIGRLLRLVREDLERYNAMSEGGA